MSDEEDVEDVMRDPHVWAALAYVVEHGAATQSELQRVLGLGLMWARRTRDRLVHWGLARTEERFEGRVRYIVTMPTDRGRRVLTMDKALRDALLDDRDAHRRRRT